MCSGSSGPQAAPERKEELRVLLSRNQLDQLTIGGSGFRQSGGGGFSRSDYMANLGDTSHAYAGLRIAG